MRTLALLSLVACGVDPVDASSPLATEVAPPPIAMDLFYQHALIRGEPVTITITGAPPNRPVYLVAGGNLVAPGACLPALAPDCLEVANPLVNLGNRRADGTGTAVFTLNIPATLGLAEVEMQAAALDGADHYLSDAPIIPVIDPPAITTIPNLRANPGLAGTYVRATGVVTAVRSNGFAFQASGAGANRGLWAFTGAQAEPAVGDVVSVTGSYELYDNNGTLTAPLDTLSEINVATLGGFWQKTGTATLPTPILVDVGTLLDPATREAHECMLLELIDAFPLTVLTDPAAPGAFREFFVGDAFGTDQFEIDNEFFDLAASIPTFGLGDSFTTITGVLFFSFDEHKLAPRSANDAAGYADVP
jgi:hypothetical protein